MFSTLGLPPWLLKATSAAGWQQPTAIQQAAVPLILEGRDLVALAETGAGKTAAFALPLVAKLYGEDRPCGPLEDRTTQCLVLAPTYELSEQIARVIRDLLRAGGASDERKKKRKRLAAAVNAPVEDDVVALVSGDNYVAQALQLVKGAPVVVGTLGRVTEHLENTAGFTLKHVKFVIVDEADRLLKEDAADVLTEVLRRCPREAQTLLFSATLTNKLQRLRKARLNNPAFIATTAKYQTPNGLTESVVAVKMKSKWPLLIALLLQHVSDDDQCIVFCNSVMMVDGLTQVLGKLGFSAVQLTGKMEQKLRAEALDKLRSKSASVLVATDVASRGLDVPTVALVINFDVPLGAKEYTHRIGRTARAGRPGRAITIVTEYDVEDFNAIESSIARTIEPSSPPKQFERLTERLERVRREVFAEARKKHRASGGKKRSVITDASLY